MSTMTPLISRDAARFDPIHGDTRYRVPPRRRTRARHTVLTHERETDPRLFKTGRDVRYFLVAFAGGFTFFSAMIF